MDFFDNGYIPDKEKKTKEDQILDELKEIRELLEKICNKL